MPLFVVLVLIVLNGIFVRLVVLGLGPYLPPLMNNAAARCPDGEVDARAANEPSRKLKFHNHGEGPY